MNLLLLTKSDFTGPKRVLVDAGDRRAVHLRTTKKIVTGDTIPAGVVNGKMGEAFVAGIDDQVIELEVHLYRDPPRPLGLTVIVALPRPKVFRRILQTVTTLGVKRIIVIRTWHVEKSYWQSPFLQETELLRQMTLGLEQAQDTVLPEVEFKKRFRPYVEDELPSIVQGQTAILADPASDIPCEYKVSGPVVIAVGPESGFTTSETAMLESAGFSRRTLGSRTFRVENVISILAGRLM